MPGPGTSCSTPIGWSWMAFAKSCHGWSRAEPLLDERRKAPSMHAWANCGAVELSIDCGKGLRRRNDGLLCVIAAAEAEAVRPPFRFVRCYIPSQFEFAVDPPSDCELGLVRHVICIASTVVPRGAAVLSHRQCGTSDDARCMRNTHILIADVVSCTASLCTVLASTRAIAQQNHTRTGRTVCVSSTCHGSTTV